MTRRTRQVGTLVLTVVAIAYLVWKIDLGTTLDVLADANLAWFAVAVVIMVGTVPVLALFVSVRHPERARAALEALNAWIRLRQRGLVIVAFSLAGAYFAVKGATELL